jgi:signal transduction histidine kinase
VDIVHTNGRLDLDRLGTTHTTRARQRLADAEARAARAESHLRDRAELLGQVEHKLKTAFAVISGWTTMLDDSWDRISESQRREAVQSIRRRSEEVVAHAQRLLEEVRSEVTALDLDPVPIDLAAVLRLSAGAYHGMSRRHTIVYAGPATVSACLDPAALQQVLGQLLENAVKYSPAGGTITLTAGAGVGREGRSVWITVADEGVGVPDGLDVFAPFERGRPAEAAIDGSGLGLYIVKNLVRAMGGTITAAANPDVGSTFTLTFPNGRT